MRRGKRLVIQAEHLDPAGLGVGRYQRYTVLAANLLPEESAEVVIDHVSHHQPTAWATVVERLSPAAPSRVEPACRQFGRCGGCIWQHVRYETQLEYKHNAVVEALGSALSPAPEVAQVIAAPSQLGYRNKGKYVVGDTPDGRIQLGAYAPRSHSLVDTIGCKVVEPVIDEAAQLTRDALSEAGLSIYSERSHTGELRYVLIRAAGDGRALVALVTTSRTPPEPLKAAADVLVSDERISGVVWVRNDLTSGALLTDDIVPLAGDETMVVTMSGVPVRVSASEFLQVNTAQATNLYAAVADAVGAGEDTSAVDLYCGVGGISFALASRGAKVLGVEHNGRAIDAAVEAADRAGISERVSFHAGDASAITSLLGDNEPSVVVVNPPRKGLTDDARAAVCNLGARTLAYVSCGPKTLARDLVGFRDVGYTIESVQPFDLMPGTPQVETLVVCRLF